MRRQFTSCFAVAALLLGSGGLRAEDVVTYVSQDYEAEGVTPDWSSATGGRFTPVIMTDAEGNHYLSVDQTQKNNNGTTLTGTTFIGAEGAIVGAGTDFTLTFDFKLGNTNQQTPVEFFINDAANSKRIFSLAANGANGSSWIINDGNVVDLPGTSFQNKDISDASFTWYTAKVVRKTYGSQVATVVTVTNKATATTVIPRTVVPTLSAEGGLGNIIMYTKRYLANIAIDNVLVTSVAEGDVPAEAPIEWTIKYVDTDDSPIATTVTSIAFPGDVIVANAAQAADFFDANGDKWIYVSGNDEKVLSETDNEITLVFRKAPKMHYTVNAVDAEGNILKELANDSIFEKESISIPYPSQILAEGNVLLATDTKSSSDGKQFNYQKTITEDNVVFTQVYTHSVDYVAARVEAEDVEGLTLVNTGNVTVRGSQSAGAYNASSEPVAVLDLQPGSYTFSAGLFGAASGDVDLYFKVDTAKSDSIKVTVSASSNLAQKNLKDSANKNDTVLVVAEPSKLFYLPSGDKNHFLDYLYARYATSSVKVNYLNGETNDTLKVATFEAPSFAASGKKYILPESYLAAINDVVKIDSTLASDEISYDYTYANMVCIGGNDSIAVVGDGTDEITLQYVDDRTEYQVVAVDTLGNEIKDWGWTKGKVHDEVVLDESYTTAFEKDDNFWAYKSGNEGTTLVKESTLNVIKLVFIKANLQYTVKFLNKDTNEELKEAAVSYAVPGDSVTATASQLEDITVGESVYSLYAPADTIVVLEGEDNILSLYFGLTTKLTVNTVDEDNNVLVDAKEYAGLFVGDSAAAEEVSLADITINENLYQLASGNDTIVLAADANEIRLVFAKKTAHYTVNFINQDDNSLLKDAIVTAGATVGDSVAPMLSQIKTVLNVAGIDYVCTVSDPKEAAILVGKVDSVNVINLYFRQNTTTYTVNFVADVDDSRVLKTAVTIAGVKPGDKVAAAKELLADIKDAAVTGETFTYASGNDTIVLDADATKNVITLVFTQKTTKYLIKYVNAEGVQISVSDQIKGNVGDVKKPTVLQTGQTNGPDGTEYVIDEEASAEVLANGITLVSDASQNVLTLVYKLKNSEAIVYISADKAKANGPIYSLNGAIVVNPGRGLYIQNGQFIMIK